MVKPKYKVVYGYSADQEIPIEEKDLEKAIYAHMTKSRARLNGIPISGENIITIVPDFHRTMGWNHSYRLQPSDHEEINRLGIGRHMINQITLAGDRVQYLIQNNQTEQIGTGITIPALENETNTTQAKNALARKKRV